MATNRRKDGPTPDGPVIADTLRRFEVITGAGRQRRWSADAKAAIVAESCEAGANMSEVTRLI